jgi:hypothetical protein
LYDCHFYCLKTSTSRYGIFESFTKSISKIPWNDLLLLTNALSVTLTLSVYSLLYILEVINEYINITHTINLNIINFTLIVTYLPTIIYHCLSVYIHVHVYTMTVHLNWLYNVYHTDHAYKCGYKLNFWAYNVHCCNSDNVQHFSTHFLNCIVTCIILYYNNFIL